MTTSGQPAHRRLVAAVRNRYGRSAVAVYGTGLGCDCGDCPTPGPEAFVPTPRPAAGITHPGDLVRPDLERDDAQPAGR